jgi:hypothetical protein
VNTLRQAQKRHRLRANSQNLLERLTDKHATRALLPCDCILGLPYFVDLAKDLSCLASIFSILWCPVGFLDHTTISIHQGSEILDPLRWRKQCHSLCALYNYTSVEATYRFNTRRTYPYCFQMSFEKPERFKPPHRYKTTFNTAKLAPHHSYCPCALRWLDPTLFLDIHRSRVLIQTQTQCCQKLPYGD